MLSPHSSTPTASLEPAPQRQVLFACSGAGHPGRTAVGTESSSSTATPFREWGGSWYPGCATTRGIHPSDSARCSRGGGNRLPRVRWGPWGARVRAEAREWGKRDLMHPASRCVWRGWLSTITVTSFHHPLFPSSVHWPDHHRVLTVVPNPAPSEFSSAGQGSSHDSVRSCWAPPPPPPPPPPPSYTSVVGWVYSHISIPHPACFRQYPLWAESSLHEQHHRQARQGYSPHPAQGSGWTEVDPGCGKSESDAGARSVGGRDPAGHRAGTRGIPAEVSTPRGSVAPLP